MKHRIEYVCSSCNNVSSSYLGRCPMCNNYNTYVIKEDINTIHTNKSVYKGSNLKDKEHKEYDINRRQKRISTGYNEVDRVLGGGLLEGSVVLLAGSPGIGKSTLALQIYSHIDDALYISGEEERSQIINRLERLSLPLSKANDIYSTASLEDVLATIEEDKPRVMIVDSLQMIGLTGDIYGSQKHLKQTAELLTRTAKKASTTLIIIGHITKNDDIAGPKMVEHIVDTVLQFDGESSSNLRFLRAKKNRFGSTEELGILEMHQNGLQEPTDTEHLFLSDMSLNSIGRAFTVLKEGVRHMLIEVQALTIKTNFGYPKRTSNGLDIARLGLLLAVLSKYSGVNFQESDVYTNVISGLKVSDTALDMAFAAALISVETQKKLPDKCIFLGEIGLCGEIRTTPYLEERLLVASKQGFEIAYIPYSTKEIRVPIGIKAYKIKTVKELRSAII